MSIGKRLQRGAAVTTVMGMIAVFSWVMTVAGTAKYGAKVGESFEVKARMASIQDEMKRVFERASNSGRISTAQAAIMKRRVDRHAALFQKMAERVVQRQGQILHANSAFFTLDIAASAFSRDYKRISDRIASTGRAFRTIDEFHIDSLFKAISGANTVTGELMDSSVQLHDLEAELGDIQKVWRQDETPFQRAMVAAKIRSFRDQVAFLELGREDRKAWFKRFVTRLSNEGWQIPGVDFRDRNAVARYVLSQLRDYRQERTEKPELQILSLQATPEEASRGDLVRLSAQVRAKGIPRAHIEAAYVAAGMDVPTRVLSTGRSDVAMEVVGDWVVQDHLPADEYGYELTVTAVDPNSIGDLLGNSKLTASRTGRVRVGDGVKSVEQLLAWIDRELKSVEREVEPICRKTRNCSKAACELPHTRYGYHDPDDEYCRLWVEKQSGGKEKVYLLDCGCLSLASVSWGPLRWASYADARSVLPGMLACIQSKLPEALDRRRACFIQWARDADPMQWSQRRDSCIERLDAWESEMAEACALTACRAACRDEGGADRHRRIVDEYCNCR